MSETPKERENRLLDEGSRALMWLNDHWKQPHICPICEGKEWGVGTVVEMREFQGGNIIIGGGVGVLPLTPIACTTCGYTFFMNALRNGSIEQPSDDRPTQ